MINIFHSTPYRSDLNIGKAYNDFCELVPDDAWICIRDQDTMFLTFDAGCMVKEIAMSNIQFDLIGCRTNRLRSPLQAISDMFNEKEISKHIHFANKLWQQNGAMVSKTDRVIAGMFMLFPKKTWIKHKFVENTPFADRIFSEDILRDGGRLGIAQGLYLFHLYRWNSNNPFSEFKHLYKCR